MSLFGVVLALLLSACGSFAAAPENVTQSVVHGPAARNSTAQPPGTVSTGTRAANGTVKGLDRGDFGVTSSMMQRALYVLIGITAVGVLYFLVRAVRLKKPVHKKKYGLLSNYDETLDMDGDDSEEDDTLYEARSLRR
ncbi:protein FAM174C [Sphaeramia orbicularis]|uniref:Uncharacterized protein n=1 Tax=Sphaeramia orbicularis TaxID=375764 RepID=A0A672ZUL6_9TELE|nr:uncharacterized membrane protein C19orf24 homolog [Sphaeramia orbicularis]